MIPVALMLMAGMVQPGVASPLDELRWSKRVLVIFTGDGTAAERQLSLLPPGGLAERDMVVLVVPPEGSVKVASGTLGDVPPAASLRRTFGVDGDAPFVALLIGKDGGVKLRRTEVLPAEALFGTIDQMPMRRREMQAR